VAAAGVWVGGLAFLALLLVEAGGDRWSLATRTVPRFSTIALVSVAALVAAGIGSGYLEVRSWSALWNTTYGRLLLAKVALLAPLLALGVFNNRRSVPRLRTGAISPAGRRAFVRAVATELALMVVVVGVTAVLVAEPPAKAAVAASQVVTRDGNVGPYDYSLTVDPAHAGANQVHIYVLAPNGQPAAVDEITVAARLPSAEVGPLDLRLTPAGPGHVTGVSELPLPGTWSFRLGVRKGEFDEWSTIVDIPIRKDS
jgi:copper transport protein